MRLQTKKPINIRNKILGGSKPLICIPIVEKDLYTLEKEAKKVIQLSPDIIEWRTDYFINITEIEKVIKAIKMLRSIFETTPLIFTLRSHFEGGFQEIEQNNRYEIIEQAIATKEVDVVDIELISGKENIKRIKKATSEKDIPLILSYHNFEKTPDTDFLINKMREQVSNGADIAKIAVMSNTEEDVLNLFYATLKTRREMPDVPLITMSMGKFGVITRIAGGLFGSDLTFRSREKTSAPGQIPVEELEESMRVLYR